MEEGGGRRNGAAELSAYKPHRSAVSLFAARSEECLATRFSQPDKSRARHLDLDVNSRNFSVEINQETELTLSDRETRSVLSNRIHRSLYLICHPILSDIGKLET